MDTAVVDEIETALAKLHAGYYGQGPRSTRAHAAGDVVVVVFEETFTPAEQILIERGEALGVQATRRHFQQVMADKFRDVVENATGREVRSFVSDTDLGEHISIEVFVLGEVRDRSGHTDMDGFEGAGQLAETPREAVDREGRER